MKKIITFFFVLIAAVWIGLQLNHDPGYVLIALNHWTIETTAWVGLLVLLAIFITLHCFLVVGHALLNLPVRLKQWRARRRAQKAQNTTRKGLIEFSEGSWASAKDHLIKALPDSETPLFNYLTAARAAQEMGDNQLRDQFLREAQQTMPDAKIAVELTQAQLQLANHQWEQALATLKHLQDLMPNHPYVLKLLMQLYQEVKDWPQLINLLPKLKQSKILSGFSYEKLGRHVYLQALQDLIKLNQKDEVIKLFGKLPAFLAYDEAITYLYCHYLLSVNEHKKAESLLRTCLAKKFDDRIIRLYGKQLINSKQLGFAEGLLKKYPNSEALYWCLANLAYQSELWGKAKNYIDLSLATYPTAQAFQLSGELFEHMNEFDRARESYRQGLVLAVSKYNA